MASGCGTHLAAAVTGVMLAAGAGVTFAPGTALAAPPSAGARGPAGDAGQAEHDVAVKAF